MVYCYQYTIDFLTYRYSVFSNTIKLPNLCSVKSINLDTKSFPILH